MLGLWTTPWNSLLKSSRTVTLGLVLALSAGGFVSPAFAQKVAFDTVSPQAVLIESETGQVLFSKEADQKMAPASMSKLMTMYLVFEALHEKRLQLDQKILISSRARSQEGSRMFIEVGDQITVDDLIKGAIVHSGNDACVALAEAIAGTVEQFADLMNKRAKDINLTGSHFVNPTGLPDPEHYMTVRDLAVLANEIIVRFPEEYKYYSMAEYTWNNITQHNRNPLLSVAGLGADGVKTGHTADAGYCLVGSAKQGDMRLVSVVAGLPTPNSRKQQSVNLLNWGFREFTRVKVARKEATIVDIPVWMGGTETVSAILSEDLSLLLPKTAQSQAKVTIEAKVPLSVPIKKGDQIATLRLSTPDHEDILTPLVASHDVNSAGFLKRLATFFRYYTVGVH